MIKNKIGLVLVSVFFSFSSPSFADDSEQITKSFSVIERIKIIKDENSRLKDVMPRRVDSGEINLMQNYIRNTKYDKHTKGLMREASYYMNFLSENHDNKEQIKKESENIYWNTMCMVKSLKEQTGVVYGFLSMINFDEESDKLKNFNKGNEMLLSLTEGTVPTDEEVTLRCVEIFDR